MFSFCIQAITCKMTRATPPATGGRGAHGGTDQEMARETVPQRRAERKELTRQALINATIDQIAASGFAETTLAKVSRRASVSRGLVNFHFASKDQLLVETLRFLTVEYLQFWQKALTKTGLDAAGRLVALIEADFHPQVCNRKKIAVWYAFWGEARSRPTYMEVCAAADREYIAAVNGLCREIAEQGGYRISSVAVSRGLRAMIDGLWLELLLSPQNFDRTAAKRTCLLHLALAFPKHFSGIEVSVDAA